MRTRHDWTYLGRFLIPLLLGALALALPGGASAAEFGRISGTVTAEGGGPLERVEVCAVPVTEEGGYGCDETRFDGTYEITRLPAGEYLVEFWAAASGYGIQWWEDASSRATATPVVVTGGQATAGIDAILEPSASISGTVTAAATGAPVRWVEACASMGGTVRCGSTDATGAYTITGLSAGTWTVYFYTYETGTELLGQPYAGGPVTVNAKEAKTGIDAALVAGGQISGTVRLASTGATLSGIRVCLFEATVADEPYWCLHSSGAGTYQFPGLPTGSYKVVFSPEAKELYPGEPEWAEIVEEIDAEEGYKPDSYATQWWNGQASFAAATPIAVTPPAAVTGIDGSLGSTASTPQATVTPTTPPAPIARKALKCKRGFVKRRIKGKARCVKRKKPKHHKPAHHGKKKQSQKAREAGA